MVFKVYSRDKLANQRLSELRFETFSKQELWLKAFVLFKSLSPVCRSWLFQISHGKYQRVSCASKEQGSLRGRRVKFQFLYFSPGFPKSSRTVPGGRWHFLKHTAREHPWFFSRAIPPHSARLSQPSQAVPLCRTLPCCPRHWPCPAHLFQDLPHQIYKSLWVITLFWPCL